MQDVVLRPKTDRRARAGHPWVFSNEIATPDVRSLPAGGAVAVHASNGAFLGRGYANPRSLIAVRLVGDARADIDAQAFWEARIAEAVAYRQALYPGRTALRLVHGEGDGLPGLVVDRFDDVLAVQITTLGVEVRKELVAGALQKVLSPRGAVLRNDAKVRELEGLPLGREVWWGDVPDEVVIDELGVRYGVEPLGGQKTGHFFDQAENRRFAASLCAGRRVLDVYAYSGGWALHALVGGAASAVAVDVSEGACARIAANATLNGVADRMTVLQGEGKKTLEALVAAGERFGAVVVDPPAFAKTRKVAVPALKGYRDVNGLAMKLVEPGGFLFTSSCSHHVEEDRFLEAIAEAAQRLNRKLRIVRRGEQAPDHPVVPAVPETRYLKSYAFHVR